jgi:hypothetical protein
VRNLWLGGVMSSTESGSRMRSGYSVVPAIFDAWTQAHLNGKRPG